MLLLRVQSFNTSHVTLYPVPEMIYLPRDSFNTSYVTLYLQNKTHLEHQSFSFNTSHITLYRRNWKRRKKVTAVSIHLMLLFIKYGLSSGSCGTLGFNTSHVTLYLEGEIIEEKPLTFQYISCYSLSISCPICFFRTVVSIHLMLLFIRTPAWPLEVNQRFQYISCYSLYRCRHRCCYIRSVSIHLMLLFIKLGYEDSDIELGFNTSHVTLYL